MALGLGIQRGNYQDRFNHVLEATDIQQAYQGLTLDQTGVGALLFAIQDRDSLARVGRINVQSKIPGREQVFDQSFPSGAIFFVTLPIFSRVLSQSDSLIVEIEMKYHLAWLIAQGGFCIVLVSLLFGLHFLYSEMKRQKARLERSRIIEEISSQVAHDIRSPIAALEVTLGEAAQLSGDVQEVARMALTRVQEIARDLLNATRPDNLEIEKDLQENFDLSGALRSVLEEKKVILSARSNISLQFTMAPNCELHRIVGSRKEFQRMLSNLLNNSIEAVGVAGSVSLNTSVKSNSVHILIQDDGPGIPLSVIERLGERGNTSGKASGTGLGLAHAVATAKKFGGTLKVTAPEFGGTIIQITLPAISPGASI